MPDLNNCVTNSNCTDIENGWICNCLPGYTGISTVLCEGKIIDFLLMNLNKVFSVVFLAKLMILNRCNTTEIINDINICNIIYIYIYI